MQHFGQTGLPDCHVLHELSDPYEFRCDAAERRADLTACVQEGMSHGKASKAENMHVA